MNKRLPKGVTVKVKKTLFFASPRGAVGEVRRYRRLISKRRRIRNKWAKYGAPLIEIQYHG